MPRLPVLVRVNAEVSSEKRTLKRLADWEVTPLRVRGMEVVVVAATVRVESPDAVLVPMVVWPFLSTVKMSVAEEAPVCKVRRFPVDVFQIVRAGLVEVAKRRVYPLIKVVSLLGASPKVALPSIVTFPVIEVVARDDPPERVTLLAKTSPSESMRNTAESLTARPRRLVSAAAEDGLITRGADVALAPATPGDHVVKE